jgi:ATP-dependent DNA helicase RecQ
MSENVITDKSLPAAVLETLQRAFGHTAFRGGQEFAVRSILAGRSVLAVMPTGSGKSLLYQLPALLADGLTLVVSPLIALMKDQVDELTRRQIPATFINSSLGLAEQRERIEQCRRGQIRLLYVAPERFRSESFVAMIRQARISRMAVDEAHCISEWGHDFRPDYRRLKDFRRAMGNPPVTALTATATPRVQKDIVESLGLAATEVDVHVHGFDRPNLALSVVEVGKADGKNSWICRFVREHAGCGIIYVGTRQVADDLAEAVRAVEPRTVVYHAGLDPDERVRAQEEFLGGRARLAVATMAFGMGIDKADVRFVLHYHYPASVEQYYQEIGRAGRDGQPSDCILLYSSADRRLREFFIDLSYPSREQVRSVYQTLVGLPANPILLTYREIADQCEGRLKDGQVGAAIRLLDDAGVTRALADDPPAWVTIDRPGAEILPKLRGQTQRAVFEALASAFDLETPGRYSVELWPLGRAAGLSDEQVRRALVALDEAGHLRYEPPPRGRGIEKLLDPAPSFERVAIDWPRHDSRRHIEEEKLDGIENYISGEGCRRSTILRYFGEEPRDTCRICDRCRQPAAATRSGGDVLARRPEIARPVLVCVSQLRFPLGVGRVAQVVTGSRDSDLLSWKLDRNPAYAAVSARQDAVKPVIEELILAGYLKRDNDDPRRPVVALTRRGQAAVEKIDAAGLAGPGRKKRPGIEGRGSRVDKEAHTLAPASPGLQSVAPGKKSESPGQTPAQFPARPGAGPYLDELMRNLLVAKPDEAKPLIEALRLFNPRHVAACLESPALTGQPQTRARAVWILGEVCGLHGLRLLVCAAADQEINVRRLAASALGKAVADQCAAMLLWRREAATVRQALQTLVADANPQVSQYARKSLSILPDDPGLPE